MGKYSSANFIFLILFVSLTANALAWAFHGEVFMHELQDHQHSQSIVQTKQENHQHKELPDEKHLNLSAHICLSAVYQSFFFIQLPLSIFVAVKEISIKFNLLQIPESFLDSPFRPPRNRFHN